MCQCHPLFTKQTDFITNHRKGGEDEIRSHPNTKKDAFSSSRHPSETLNLEFLPIVEGGVFALCFDRKSVTMTNKTEMYIFDCLF